MLTVLTTTRSEAAFSATTDNTANAFATGSVELTDDDTGTAMFTVTDMSPGTPEVNCIEVTYSGSIVPADVKMYGTTTGALDTYLDTTIEVGTGGVFDDCTGFTPTSTIYTGTLEAFATTHADWGTGLAVFTAAANPEVVTLRFTVDVQNDPLAQGLTSTADFTFEAQG
jgi:hypothetical protein